MTAGVMHGQEEPIEVLVQHRGVLLGLERGVACAADDAVGVGSRRGMLGDLIFAASYGSRRPSRSRQVRGCSSAPSRQV